MIIDNNFDFENMTLNQVVDALGNTIEYTNAFVAIEELMCPGAGAGKLNLHAVGRDELSSLIRVVNDSLRRHVSEITAAAVKLRALQDKIPAVNRQKN